MPQQDPNRCLELATKIVKLPVGDRLKALVELQREFGSRFCNFDSLDDADRIFFTQYYLSCISNELEEIRDWLPWKQHKKYKGFKLEPTEIQFEIIDVLLYLLNLCAIWGMDSDLIATRFLQKHAENIKRQESEY